MFLAKGEPSFELVTLFLDVKDLNHLELGLGLVGSIILPLLKRFDPQICLLVIWMEGAQICHIECG